MKRTSSFPRAAIRNACIAAVFGLSLPAQVSAAPAWANYAAQRTCQNIRKGMSAGKAGEVAAYQTMAAGYSSPLMAAHNNGTFKGIYMATLVAACPQTLMNAR